MMTTLLIIIAISCLDGQTTLLKKIKTIVRRRCVLFDLVNFAFFKLFAALSNHAAMRRRRGRHVGHAAEGF